MTKLSELLQVREQLCSFVDYNDHEQAFEKYKSHLRDLFDNNQLVQQPYQTLIQGDVSIANTALQNIKERCKQAINDIDLKKRDIEPHYYNESQRLYYENLYAINSKGLSVIKNNVLRLTPEDFNLIDGRLGLFTDWRMPGLLIRPGNDDFINRFVAFDPLYLADISLDLLYPAIKKYNETFQRRLRKYVISDDDDKIFGSLPQNQFGFCFAHNFFNVRTITVISKYMRDIWDVLRPGGIFAFTFCDADKSRCVQACESNFYCYTPGSVIEHLRKSIGYKLNFKHESSADWTYLELQKTGTPSSFRAGQSLAQILPIQS